MTFCDFIEMEKKQYFSKRNLLLLVSVLLLSFYFVFNGIKDYNQTLKNSREFQKCEAISATKIRNYEQFSIQGVKFMFVPSALGALCSHPAVLSDINARINSVVTLDINNNLKGKSVLSIYLINHLRFPEIILLAGSLLALYLGYGTLRNQDYMRFLSSCLKKGTVFWMLTMTRFILLFLTFLAIFGLMIAFVLLAGVHLTGTDWKGIGIFGLSATVMLLFFFLAGVFIGCPHPGSKGKSTLQVTWFLFIFIIPLFFYSILDSNINDLTPSFKLDTDKLKIVGEFEERSLKEKGNFDRNKIKTAREIIESYWNNDYQNVVSLEIKLKNEIKNNYYRVNFASMITPSSFFYLTSIEAGSRGPKNFMAYYNHLIEMHKKVVRFYIDQCFISTAPPQMVPFINGNENLFKVESRVPAFFLLGLIINLGYCFIVGMASFYRFKKMLKGEMANTTKLSINEKDLTCIDGVKVLYIQNQDVPFLFYNHYRKEDGFFYICHPNHIPGDIEAKDFARFVSRIVGLSLEEQEEILNSADFVAIKGKNLKRMNAMEKGDLLLSIICRVKRRCYLFDNIALGMPIEFTKKLKDWMVSTAGSGAQVIYLTSESWPSDNRYNSSVGYEILETWLTHVDRISEANEKRLNSMDL